MSFSDQFRKPYDNGKGPTEASIQESLIGWFSGLENVESVDFEIRIGHKPQYGAGQYGYLDVAVTYKDHGLVCVEVKRDFSDIPGAIRQIEYYQEILSHLQYSGSDSFIKYKDYYDAWEEEMYGYTQVRDCRKTPAPEGKEIVKRFDLLDRPLGWAIAAIGEPSPIYAKKCKDKGVDLLACIDGKWKVV